MSSLDQAFIKAYQGHGGHPAGLSAEGAKTVPLADAFSEPPTSYDPSEPAIVPLDAVLETLSTQSRVSAQNASYKPTPRHGETEEASAETASPEPEGHGRPGNAARGPTDAACTKARRRTALLRIWPQNGLLVEVDEQQGAPRAPQLDDLDLPDVVPLPGVRPAEDQSTPPPEEPSDSRAPAPEEPSQEASAGRAYPPDARPQPVIDSTGPPSPHSRAGRPAQAAAETEAAGASSLGEEASPGPSETATQPAAGGPAALETSAGRAGLHPLLQVDYFHWPRLCRRLAGMAGEELQRLSGWLEQSTAQGRRVIAFGAHQRGEGATSLLLAAARRLGARGLRVVLVDADFSRPQLAGRLGLVPQVGWEAVLAGRAELAEAMIESIEDRLVLLPVRDAFAGAGLPLGHEAAVGRSLEQLAATVDLVLVDVGPLKERAVVDGLLLRAMGPVLDALVLVENVAATARTRLAEVEQRLAAAGVPVAGVVENLVRRA